MFYNTYCNARVTLSDGRVYVFGGHDMQSNNGLYKVNIFDPDTETWVKRSEPCDRSNWTTDPFGRALFAGDPDAPFYNRCDPRNQQSTQPSDPSDQEYARWYPSAAALPNDQVLVLGGFDQDNTVAPDPDRKTKGMANQSQSDTCVHGDTREHRGAGSLRSGYRSEHLARERADGVPALSADGGRPDRAWTGTTGRSAPSTARSTTARSRVRTRRERRRTGTRKVSGRRAEPGSASAAARLPSQRERHGAWTWSRR